MKSLPIYTKSLELFAHIGAEKMRFKLNPDGGLIHNYRNNTLDAYIDSSLDKCNWTGYLAEKNRRINIQSIGSIFSSPFKDAYVFGDCCWVINSYAKSAVVPETVKSLAICSSKIGDLVIAKSVEFISISSASADSINTYYISKEAKLSLVCILIKLLASEYRGDGENTYFSFEENTEGMFYRKEYERIWEVYHEDRYKEYLDKVLNSVNIVVY